MINFERLFTYDGNTFFNEDCISMMDRYSNDYHYVITSPPDADELENKSIISWHQLMHGVIRRFDPLNEFITIILRDRKQNGGVQLKHSIITQIMTDYGWILKSQRIWVRSFKANLYRYNYSFILTFKHKTVNAAGIKFKPVGEQKLPDVIEMPISPIDGYVDNYPPNLLKPFIECYTKPGQVVFDPFMGSAATAVAAIDSDRKWLGTEILKPVFEIGINQITKAYENLERKKIDPPF